MVYINNITKGYPILIGEALPNKFNLMLSEHLNNG